VLPVTRIRFAALPLFLIAAAFMVVESSKPIVLVDERGANVALQTDLGLVPAVPKSAASSVSRWLSQAGDTANFKTAFNRKAWTCENGICLANSAELSIAYLPKQAIPTWRCPNVDVLISQDPLRRLCKGKRATIDRFDVWRNGAYAVFANGQLDTAKSSQGARPWVYEPRARAKP
jgi:competence protein ComEC